MHKHSFPFPYVLVFGAARSGVGAAHLLRIALGHAGPLAAPLP